MCVCVCVARIEGVSVCVTRIEGASVCGYG